MDRVTEAPAIEELKQLARLCRLQSYSRDAFVEHVRQKQVRGMARLFSESITGLDGEVHLPNADYRLLVGTIRNALGAKDDIDMQRAWNSGVEEARKSIMPSSTVIFDRMDKLMSVETSAPLDRKLRDLQRLVEISYPLGTIITDPAGGENAFLPGSSAFRIGPARAKGVVHSLEFMPEEDSVIERHVIQDCAHSYVSQTVLANNDLIAVGKTRFIHSFFRQKFANIFHLDASVDIGDDHPMSGWLVAARIRGRVAFMMKHLGTKAQSTTAAASMDASGEVKTVVQSLTEAQDGHILSVRQWGRPERAGAHFVHTPEVQYDFYTGERAINTPFGKTVRTERASTK